MRFKLACASTLIFLGSPAGAVEEPPFQIVSRWEGCELRAYPTLVVAETPISGSRAGGESSGFRALAGYIFGSNAKSEKIEMTAPVVETPSGEGWTMRFTMPQGHDLGNLPAPSDAKVRTKVIPPARLGVIAFSGFASDRDLASKGRELADCLKAHGLEPAGPAALAQYDPPWVLGPWRRNEVMIPVK